MKNIVIDQKQKNLFLFLLTFSLILMMLLTTLLWWFISPRLHEIHKTLAFLILTALRVFYIVVILGIISILMTAYLGKDFLISKPAIRLAIRFLFPITITLGRLIGINKDRVRESFVHVNNTFVKVLKKKFQPDRILILLPHCLQWTQCPYRITIDINNCRSCGKCNICELKTLAEKTGVKIAIATGGTLARKIIIQNRPRLIIAVACQRDLVDGLNDVFPIPVYGVLNERPEGPCVNTRVVVSLIEAALNEAIEP